MDQIMRNRLTDIEFRQKVALRAYELYEDRGGQNGRDIDDWLQAESDVLSEAVQQREMLSTKKPPLTSQLGKTLEAHPRNKRRPRLPVSRLL